MVSASERGAAAMAVAVTMLALGLAALPVFMLGALSVQIQNELGFSSGELGFMFTLFFLVAALSSAVMGRVSERLGPRASLRMATIVSACSFLGIGVLGRSLPLIGVFSALAGVSGALVHPASNLLLSRTVSWRRLGLSLGIKQSGIPVATLLAGLAVPAFGLTVGWRWAFIAAACLSLLVAASVPPTVIRDQAADPMPASRSALPRRHMIVLTIGLGCGTAGATSLGGFAVPTLVDAGMRSGLAGIMIALASCIGIATRLVVGDHADRHPGRELWLIATMLATGSLAYVAIASGASALVFAAIPVAFGAGWGWLGLFDLAIVRLNAAAPGAATGVSKTGAFLGGMVGPATVGAVVDRASFGPAWLVIAVFAAVAAACIATVARHHSDTGTTSRAAGDTAGRTAFNNHLQRTAGPGCVK